MTESFKTLCGTPVYRGAQVENDGLELMLLVLEVSSVANALRHFSSLVGWPCQLYGVDMWADRP